MKVLITGAAGFIGQHLLRSLQPICQEIHCVIRDPSKWRHPALAANQLELIEGDLAERRTYDQLPSRVDAVVHLAASLGSWDMRESSIMADNAVATQQLLDWFKRAAARQFIFVSTPGVQGFGHRLAKEDLPYAPRGLYEISKAVAEKRVTHCPLNPEQYWTILRPDFVYGPGDYRRLKLYRRIKSRRWFRIGDGCSVLRPTFVEDVAEAIVRCIGDHAAQNQIYNVAGPELLTVDEYIQAIATSLGVKLPGLRIPVGLLNMAATLCEAGARISKSQPIMTRSQVEFLTQDHGTAIGKIHRHLGFTPRVNFEQGIQQTIAWANQNNLL